MKQKTVFGTGKHQIEVGYVDKSSIQGTVDEHVCLMLSEHGSIRVENNEVLSIDMTKEDTIDFAIQLLKMASGPVPEGGITLDTFNSSLEITVHHAQNPDHTLTEEAIICIEGIDPDTDFQHEDGGTLSACVANYSIKELIPILAKIV